MIGRTDTFKILEKVLSFAKGFELQVDLRTEDLRLTRFSQNHIHQNLHRYNQLVTVWVMKGQRQGVATVNLIDDGSLRFAVQEAVDSMEASQEAQVSWTLPKPQPIAEVQTYFSSTANLRPKDRAEACGIIIDMAKSNSLKSSGSLSSCVYEKAICSTTGVRAYNLSTNAYFRTIIESAGNTGYAESQGRDVRDIDFRKVGEEALSKAVMFPKEINLEPGKYDTVFEEYAVAELIRFLGYLAFGAETKQQGKSFMSYQMGQKVMSDNVTIWDDGLSLQGLACPFDDEGMPKQKVILIENGVAKNVVYDTQTALQEGVSTTGHAVMRRPYEKTPMPNNMFMATGNSTKQEMIENTSRGLLVTRFHYTHCPEPMKIVATGTTRDGTFLIEGGKIVGRVKDLRFTESIFEAFSRVEAISNTARLTRDWWGTFTSVLPSMKINGFTFTG